MDGGKGLLFKFYLVLIGSSVYGECRYGVLWCIIKLGVGTLGKVQSHLPINNASCGLQFLLFREMRSCGFSLS